MDGQARTNLMTNCGTNWRSKNVKVGKFDGVHFYSRQGQEAMTCSMLEVLRQAGLVRNPKPVPSTQPRGQDSQPRGQDAQPSGQAQNQWQTVGRGPRQAATNPAPFNIPLLNRFQGN